MCGDGYLRLSRVNMHAHIRTVNTPDGVEDLGGGCPAEEVKIEKLFLFSEAEFHSTRKPCAAKHLLKFGADSPNEGGSGGLRNENLKIRVRRNAGGSQDERRVRAEGVRLT